ncbi:MAG: hypothetical protein L6277_12815 [Desulfobacterales bacterium]|nr:hypothetical protein [Desulfobacterales bacterium]
MLPDLPNLKRDLHLFFDRLFIKILNARLGIFGEIPKSIAHEGNRMRTIRADGSVEDSVFKKSSVDMEINLDENPHLTIKQRIAMFEDSAVKMADQISKHMFDSLNEALEKAGQVIDHQGKPLNAEVVFEVLESMQLEFDKTGKFDSLSLVVGPALEPKARQVLDLINSDLTLRKRLHEIMEKKRLEWRARETARKLVG